MVTIHLTDEEAELFKRFRQYQDKFQSLLITGALDITSGTGTIEVDKDSRFRKISVSSVVFIVK